MRILGLMSVTLLLVASMGCSKNVEDPAPLQTGSKLVYDVVEQYGQVRLDYQVTMSFTKDGDEIVANMSSSEAKVKLGNSGVSRLDLAGLSENGDDMTLVTTTGQVVNLGGLYLPAKDRRQGVVTKIGRITKRRPYEKWDTWEMLHDRGGAQGNLYFDNQLGMLVGWNIQVGGTASVAKLAFAQ